MPASGKTRRQGGARALMQELHWYGQGVESRCCCFRRCQPGHAPGSRFLPIGAACRSRTCARGLRGPAPYPAPHIGAAISRLAVLASSVV